jgi:hypothetical protein
MALFISIVLKLLCVIVLYFFVIRPRTLRWGATYKEAQYRLTGNDIVKKPHFVATRAVTINAPPNEVWKWIIQIGSKRAGWYSIDWIDNGGVPSAKEILPEFQKIEEGYFIPFTLNQKHGMWVKEYIENEYILWGDKKNSATWGWFLKQMENNQTRLITRLRIRYKFTFPRILFYILTDLGDFIMMRKCMLGIKERAENNFRNHHLHK